MAGGVGAGAQGIGQIWFMRAPVALRGRRQTRRSALASFTPGALSTPEETSTIVAPLTVDGARDIVRGQPAGQEPGLGEAPALQNLPVESRAMAAGTRRVRCGRRHRTAACRRHRHSRPPRPRSAGSATGSALMTGMPKRARISAARAGALLAMQLEEIRLHLRRRCAPMLVIVFIDHQRHQLQPSAHPLGQHARLLQDQIARGFWEETPARRNRRRRATAASAAAAELIPQILTATGMGWGLWARRRRKSSKPRNSGPKPLKSPGFGQYRGPPGRGPARPVMGRPITRMLAPASRASAGPITRRWSPRSRARGPDARHHQQEIRSQRGAQPRDLMRRTDHAIQAALLGQRGQAQHLIAGRRRQAHRRQIVIAQGWSAPSRRSPWSSGLTLRAASTAAFIIAAPPAAWTLRMDTPKPGRGAHRARHRVGNVVEFQIQEDRQAHVEKGAHAVRSMGAEEFQSQLQAADMSRAAAPPARGHIPDRWCRWRRRRDSWMRARRSHVLTDFGRTAIQPFAQFLAGAEKRRALLAHRNRLAGARIAAHA